MSTPPAAANVAPKTVKRTKDRAGVFNVSLLVTAVVLAVATFILQSLTPGSDDHTRARIAVMVIATLVAVLGFAKWQNERAFKAQEAAAKISLADDLDAERLRILTITNGAFQATARRLQEISAASIGDRQRDISGFRQSVVDKACDLVRSDSPRAAYFQVTDLASETPNRVMKTFDVVASRGRTDEFTAEFDETSSRDHNVWKLIDYSDDAELVLKIPGDVPAGFDVDIPRVYKSYISVPVRAGGIAFGMLTINSLESNGFTDQDKASMKVLARLLAAAECVSRSTNELTRIKTARSARLS